MKWRGGFATRWPVWGWPLLILVSGLASGGALFADWRSPLRALLILWFVVVCPGMALVRLLRLRDNLAEVTLAIALSIALATIVSSVVLYAGLWSPTLILASLIAISVVGAILQLLFPRGAGADGTMPERETR